MVKTTFWSNTLSRYIFKHLFLNFALVAGLLTFALSLERLLRIVQIAGSTSATVPELAATLGYLLPHYLSLAVPAGQFFACLVVLRKFHGNSELMPMLGSGASLHQLMKPLFGFAIFLSICMLILTGYIQPHSRFNYRQSYQELVRSNLFNSITPGVFQNVGNDVTIRVEDIDPETQRMEQFFASAKSEEHTRELVVAKWANLSRSKDNLGIIFELHEGAVIQEVEGKPKFSVYFENYPWQVPLDDLYQPTRERGKDEREMTYDELYKGNLVQNVEKPTTQNERMAELHSRIVQSLSIPLLTLLAFPLAFLGSGRTGKAYGFVIGVICLVLYEKMLGLGEAFASKGDLPVWTALWIPYLILGLAAWITNSKKVMGGISS